MPILGKLNFKKDKWVKMKNFINIAKLIRSKRLAHSKQDSQSELSELLSSSDKNIISEIERGLQGVSKDIEVELCNLLEISIEELKEAQDKDDDRH